MTGGPPEAYDRIGRSYATTRQADPRIRQAIWSALGDATTVVNVGAGAGSYEPPETVLAVERSTVMISQRPAGSAPAVQGVAEALPLADGACDAALAVLTMHHWTDQARGVAEMRRVACRVVIFTWDPAYAETFWFARDYLPQTVDYDRERCPTIAQVCDWMGGVVDVRVVPVPRDCTDGFFCAYWSRPEAYLDPVVRAGMSNLASLGEPVGDAVRQLAHDLETGAWRSRNRAILDLPEFDFGYRLLVSG